MRRHIEANKSHMERLKRHLQDKDAQSPVLEDQMKVRLEFQQQLHIWDIILII